MKAWHLLLVAAFASLGPGWLAGTFGGRLGAWEYAAYGLEAAAVWAMLWHGIERTPAAMWVCIYAGAEAGLRAVSRLAFPMDAPPLLKPGQFLADAATGLPVSYLSAVALGVLVVVVVREFTIPVRPYSVNKQNGGA